MQLPDMGQAFELWLSELPDLHSLISITIRFDTQSVRVHYENLYGTPRKATYRPIKPIEVDRNYGWSQGHLPPR